MDDAELRRGGKFSHWKVAVFLLGLAAAAGWLAGMRLSEEKRGRAAKLLFEAKEMPFRLFV